MDGTIVTSLTPNGTDANRGKTIPPNEREGSLLLLRPFRHVRPSIIAITLFFMLIVNDEPIRESGLEGMSNVSGKRDTSRPQQTSNHLQQKEYQSSMTASIVALVKEKLEGGIQAEPEGKTNTPVLQAQHAFRKKLDTTLHSTNTPILDLLDWERESLHGIADNATSIDWSNPWDAAQPASKSCHPPNGISEACCLGSFSHGGEVHSVSRWQCGASLQPTAMEQLQEAVHQFYRDNPLLNNRNGENQCDVCQIVELAHQHSLHIVLMGDSMHSQIAQGLDCELERRNYRVQTQTIQKEYSTDKLFNRRHSHSKIFQVSSPEWPLGHAVTITYHMVYMVPLCEGCGDFESLTANADVVILGFGLHWWHGPTVAGEQPDHRQEGYIKNMAEVFEMIRAQGRVQLLVHRETSAQHFDGDGGGFEYWIGKQHSSPAPECKALNEYDHSVYWREKSIQQSAQRLGMKVTPAGPNMPPPPPTNPLNNLTEIVSLPYFHFTAGFPGMHPKNYLPEATEMDCTHYCGSPFMYYPLWRSLRFAMDRRWRSRY